MSNVIASHAEFVNNDWADTVVGSLLSGSRDVKEVMVNLMPVKMAGELYQQRISDAFRDAKIVQNIFN